MIILTIILCLIIGCGLGYLITRPQAKKAIEIEQWNEEIQSKNQQLKDETNKLEKSIQEKKDKCNELIDLKYKTEQDTALLKQEVLNAEARKRSVQLDIEQLKEQAEKNAQAMFETSEKLANEKMSAAADKMARVYQDMQEQLELEYLEMQEEYCKQFQQELADSGQKLLESQTKLDKLLAQIRAATAAANREKQIQEKPEDFTINLSSGVLEDIKKLNVIKKELNNPRILSMLIWQNFVKTPLDSLCDKTFGKDNVCGIYKLTNLLTNEMYVGQSSQCKERMRQHFKAGLGIDTPATNKLYANMIEYGVWNFSIELLEECAREELNEKEKYYIDLYSSNHSLNSTSGNN